MSLLSNALESCVMLKQSKVADESGGYNFIWTNGFEFKAAITFDTSLQALIAQQQGVTNRYTVTTSKNFILKYHNVFRRLSDDKIFRVTSDGDDKYTPISSSLDMRQVTAEEWILPDTNGVTTKR